MNPRNFFAAPRRPNVYKVAVAYAVVTWLLIQVATQVFPFFDVPHWALRLVVLLLILGLPVALILSWAFEITPEGIKRAEKVDPNESIAPRTGRKLIGLTIALALVAAGLMLTEIEAQFGETEFAINHLEQLLAAPAGFYLSDASLRTDPAWDWLRQDPRVEKLVGASAAATFARPLPAAK